MRLRILPVLIVMAVVLLGVKVGDFWQGFALAAPTEKEMDEAPKEATTAAEAAAAQPGDETAPEAAPEAMETASRQVDPFSLTDGEIELLQKLGERRRELDRRGSELERREALLSAAETRIEGRISELRVLQAEIKKMLVQRDEKEEAQFRSLVQIYSSMKPKEAARIFEELEMTVLLEVIDRMKERKSAPILAKMDPNRAKEVTIELAARHKLPIPEK